MAQQLKPTQKYSDLEYAFGCYWLEMARKVSQCENRWDDISSNDNITDQMIRDHNHLPWEDMGLIYNHSISWDLLRDRIQYSWSLDVQSLEYKNKSRIVRDAESKNHRVWKNGGIWKYLSEHPSICPEAIDEFPEVPWDWYEIYQNQNFDLKEIKARFIQSGSLLEEKLVLSVATLNPSIPFSYIKTRSDVPWNFRELCACKKITIDDIKTHPNLYWDAKNMSRNPNINLDFVIQTYDNLIPDDAPIFKPSGHVNHSQFSDINICLWFDWNWFYLSSNPAISLQEIDDHPELPWDDEGLSSHPELTLQYVENHPEKKWNWANIQIQCKLELDHLLRICPRHELKWNHISSNHSIGWDDVFKYPSKPWDWHNLLRNPMTHYRGRWIQEKRVEWIAAHRIHRWYRWVSCCPDFTFARKKILKELHSSD